MTYIRDLDDVRTDRRRRPPPIQSAAGVTIGHKLGICGAVALTVLTGMNVWASQRLYLSSNELASVQQRLEQLSLFEKRLTDKIDLVNNGLQGQFDRLTTTVSSRVDGAAEQIGQVETALGAVRQTIADRQLEVASIASPGAQLADIPVVPQKSPRVVRRNSETRPQISSSFERVLSADGKLMYRKVRP
jgi:hypothetical protein